MPTLDLVTQANEKAGNLELNPVVFEAPIKQHLLHAEVRRQLARRHRGTHSTKNRSAVSGGTSKPWRQKGTGRARHGTTRAPQWSGGGSAFGPVPRSYEHSLPKKVRRAALRGALSHRFQEGAITVVDDIELGGFKTRRMVEILKALSLDATRLLIVIDVEKPAVERSARNLPRVTVVRAAGLNVYDVLRHSKLLLTRAAVEAVEARLRDPEKGASS